MIGVSLGVARGLLGGCLRPLGSGCQLWKMKSDREATRTEPRNGVQRNATSLKGTGNRLNPNKGVKRSGSGYCSKPLTRVADAFP